LFGTTTNGGASSDGTVFEIAKSGSVYSSTPTMLASFSGTNGVGPLGNLIMDSPAICLERPRWRCQW